MKLLFLSVILLYCHHTLASGRKNFTTCSRKWVKLGCFHDSFSPRPLPDLLLNDRDVFSPANDGHVLDWEKWTESQHSLACRCAEKARAKGYKVFGLQFYGECWGGPNGEALFSKDGPSDNCIQQLSKPYACVKQDPFTECVGGESTNYVYRLVDNTPEPQSPDVDGGYSKWSDWSACSKTCGVGEKIRERTCNNPSPKGNGKPCEELGPGVETARCRLMDCASRCERAMDVGILVDSSSSVRRSNFNLKVKPFLVKLVQEFSVSESMTHVGVVRYNHYAKLMWDFSDKEYYDPTELAKAIRNIEFKPGGTRTDLGMEMAGRLLFRGPGARAFVPHVLLVLTDGKTSRQSRKYSEVLKILKSQVPDLKVIAIGVGSVFQEKNNKELEQIADGNKANVFKLNTFDELVKRMKDIVKAFCQTRL